MSTDRYLAHHGVKGQKWGIRRYQNADGTLTSEGRKRYNVDMYSHSGNRIYSPLGANAKVKKRSNAANSLQGGAVYNDFERRLKRQLKRDYRDSYKKGYITRDEYRQGKKVAKSSSKKIAEQRLGSTAKKYGRVSKVTNAAINGTLMATGATLAAYHMKNTLNDAKDLNRIHRSNVDNAQKYGGYGSYREINSDGSSGKTHTPWKEVYKDARRQAYGKKSKYGYYSFDHDNGAALAHHGIKGQKWGVRRYQNQDGTLTPEGMRRYDIAGNLLGGNNKHVTNADSYNLLRDTSYGMMKKDYKHGIKQGGNRRELRKDYKIAKKSVDAQMRKVYGNEMADAADKKYRRDKAASIAGTSVLALGTLATAAALGKKGYDKYKYKHPTYSYGGQKTKNFSDYLDAKYGKLNHSEFRKELMI